jgi:plastocyanin
VSSAAGGVKEGAKEAAGVVSGTAVNMSDSLKFDPPDVTISKGGTVTWQNTGATVHTATDDPTKASNPADAALPAGAKAWDSGDVQPDGKFSHTFDTAGTYKYFCTPHESAGMVGTITVK